MMGKRRRADKRRGKAYPLFLESKALKKDYYEGSISVYEFVRKSEVLTAKIKQAQVESYVLEYEARDRIKPSKLPLQNMPIRTEIGRRIRETFKSKSDSDKP